MAKEQKRSKKGFSLKILFIIELLACYMSILAVISYWRGPVRCRALPDEPLLQAEDFVSFAGEAVAENSSFQFHNDTAGNVVGYAAWLDLAEVDPIAVSFMVDCSEENIGSLLHIDLWNDDYDSDEQEFKLALQAGINKVEFFLDKGLNAPETAQLRFFTIDLADYVVQNVQVCRTEPMPKVSSALLAGMIVCIVLLLITVPLMFKSEREYALADTWRKAGEYEEEVPVNGIVEKIVRRLVGWYVEPVYRQNAYLKDQLEQCQLTLADSQQQLEKNQQDLLENKELLAEYRQRLIDNEKKFAESLMQMYNRLNSVQKQIDSQANIVANNENDYINDNQTAIIYAYRYLLNRDPENKQMIDENVRGWRELRQDIMGSEEYRIRNSKS